MGVGQLAGRFRLVHELGSGGFGSVYLGEDGSGRLAAVKLLHPHLAKDTQVRRYFTQELANMRQVQGFCLAEVLDADAGAEQPWIATEYIKGPTLEEAVRDRGTRAGGDLQRLAMHTITALNAIHAAGVVHRDLKPANILLGPDGPRVIDFGIARALDADTHSATQIGTLGYMAPEQLEGTTLGPAADLFAWGAVIVYAATGADAFPGPTQAARINRVLTQPPDTGELTGPLLSIVLACLHKDPHQRPTARQVFDMLLTGGAAPPPTGDDVPTAEYTAPPGGARSEPVLDPHSWNSSATDTTPFTPDALLPEQFATDRGAVFARVAAGVQPCTLAAAGEGTHSAAELVQELTGRGCSQVVAGVYEEQPGHDTVLERPVLVSVSVFAFADDGKATEMYSYLGSDRKWWNLTTWSRPMPRQALRLRGDIVPQVPRPKCYRYLSRGRRYRYVITALAYRADLTSDGDIEPWLKAATDAARDNAGPEHHWLGLWA